MTFQTLKLSEITISNDNPRKTFDDETIAGLAQSIKTDGLLQNLTVAEPKGKKKQYPIICGERRFRALQLLENQGDLPADFTIPVEVKSGLSNEAMLRIAIMENMQRENMPPLEEAQVLSKLVKDGNKLDDIIAQTGLAVSTIRRRLVLMDLSQEAQGALSRGEISLSQAEALSLGSHEKQSGLLNNAISGWLHAEDIKNRLVGNLPTLSMAIFDTEQYQGDFTSDLLAEDDTTYFNDVDQFMALQKSAAEKLAEEHEQKADWVRFVEGYFSSWSYNEAVEGETGGVVVVLSSSGEVEVHEGLIQSKADDETAQQLSRAKSTYSRPLVNYMSMQKSIAVQAALLDNPRTAKELLVAQQLAEFRYQSHKHLEYFDQEGINPPALQHINVKSKEVYSLVAAAMEEDIQWSDFGSAFVSVESAYDYVQTLADEELERISITLTMMKFGQSFCDSLDTDNESIFNKVARDLNVDMRNYWRPDELFLKRRNKAQLQQIIVDAGMASKLDNAATYKKKDLVSAMTEHFQYVLTVEAPSEDELKAVFWIPEAMAFPAIDPDVREDEAIVEGEADLTMVA